MAFGEFETARALTVRPAARMGCGKSACAPGNSRAQGSTRCSPTKSVRATTVASGRW